MRYHERVYTQFRCPEDLWEWLRVESALQHRSMNSQMIHILQRARTGHDPGPEPKSKRGRRRRIHPEPEPQPEQQEMDQEVDLENMTDEEYSRWYWDNYGSKELPKGEYAKGEYAESSK